MLKEKKTKNKKVLMWSKLWTKLNSITNAPIHGFNHLFIFFLQVTTGAEDEGEEGEEGEDDDDDNGGGFLGNMTGLDDDAILGDDDDEDLEEWVVIEEKVFYLEPVIRILALIHSIISFCMLIAYYNLKVIYNSLYSEMYFMLRKFCIFNMKQTQSLLTSA